MYKCILSYCVTSGQSCVQLTAAFVRNHAPQSSFKINNISFYLNFSRSTLFMSAM